MQPEVVRSLHLIEPPLLDLLPEQPLVQEMDPRAQWIVDHHAESAMRRPRKRSSQWSVPSARSSVCGHARLGSPLRSCHPIRAWRARRLLPELVVDQARQHCPSWTLHGRSEPSRATPGHRGAGEQDQGARLVDVPGAGHAVQMAKDVFVDALLALAHDADLDPARTRLSNAHRCRPGITGAGVTSEATKRRTRFRCRQCLSARRALQQGLHRRR